MKTYDIKVNKVSQSKLNSVDIENIAFGTQFSDHMFTADYIDGQWTNYQIEPFAPLTLCPSTCSLHYGQAIFEGSKAFKTDDGEPILFRPEMHAKRLNLSAQRMCMPELPEDLFIQGLKLLLEIDQDWIPNSSDSALYLRPFMIATEKFLGVRASKEYKFIIFTGPVGPYYSKAVTLKAEEKYVRAAEGGVGEAKVAGNYGASLLPAQKVVEEGYDQVMWLDAKEFKYIQEVGTMNLFFVIGNTVVTPSTDGAILKGITRDSFIQILKSKGIKVEERKISIDEIMEAGASGELKEAFGAGTAAVVAPIASITYRDKTVQIPDNLPIGSMLKTYITDLRKGRIEDKFNWIYPVLETVTV